MTEKKECLAVFPTNPQPYPKSSGKGILGKSPSFSKQDHPDQVFKGPDASAREKETPKFGQNNLTELADLIPVQ